MSLLKNRENLDKVETCQRCNGTGEGSTEGSYCTRCGGSGEVGGYDPYEDEEAYYDMMYDRHKESSAFDE